MSDSILITGTAGFIGFHLARRLLNDSDHTILGFDNLNDYYPVSIKRSRVEILKAFGDRYIDIEGDLADLGALQQAFQEHRPTLVCNLAAQAAVRHSLRFPFTYQRSNLEGFLGILECCRHHEVRRLVYASSSSVYGKTEKLPFAETDRVDVPVSLYGATKKANELMAHCYSHLYNFQTIGLRFFTVYGPWGRPDMGMWIFAEKILRGDAIPVFNQGRMKRDFTYIDDIISGLVNSLFVDGLEPYEIFNLGNSRCEELMEMIGILEQAVGKSAKLEMLPAQPGDVVATFADVTRAKEKLGYAPTTPISEGIPKFCEWYLAHPAIANEAAEWRRTQT